VKARQERLTRKFTKRSLRWIYDPRLRAAVAECISDQFERFLALYGQAPTHVDGHHHVDLCPNVFLSRAIPSGTKVRNTLHSFPLEKSPVGVARAVRQALASRRFASTDYLFHIRDIQPLCAPVASRLRLARQASVEVMAHPAFRDECTRLMSASWARAMQDNPLGSFADLAARSTKPGNRMVTDPRPGR
jgi:predicted glycoside hydrolase/deacetylase ChbG (UPF0249 family)